MWTISRVREGDLHDTVIWTRADQRKTLLWVVKDRRLVRRLLELNGNEPWERIFPLGGSMCFELPYGPKRPLERFAALRKQRPGKKYLYRKHPEEKHLGSKALWLQTVSICMTGGLPCELLCLLLKERKLQISREGEIYFSYDVDLADLPQDASEKECVSLCAETLLALMRKNREKEPSIALLIRKKKKRGMYTGFTQLYHDVNMYEPEPAFYTIWAAKAKAIVPFREEQRRKLFLAAILLAVVVIAAAAVLFISQAMTGEMPFSFLSWGSLQQIGTEFMSQ